MRKKYIYVFAVFLCLFLVTTVLTAQQTRTPRPTPTSTPTPRPTPSPTPSPTMTPTPSPTMTPTPTPTPTPSPTPTMTPTRTPQRTAARQVTPMRTRTARPTPTPRRTAAENGNGDGDGEAFEEVTRAIAVINPAAGQNIRGTVTFTKVSEGVRIVADINGLTPGLHGFHIHEYGDCSNPSGSSAGGHFNPTGSRHGHPEEEERHVGDLGNIEADASGQARYVRIDRVISLEGENSIIGHAVVIHERADDFMSQPSGNSGTPVACGVIGIDQY